MFFKPGDLKFPSCMILPIIWQWLWTVLGHHAFILILSYFQPELCSWSRQRWADFKSTRFVVNPWEESLAVCFMLLRPLSRAYASLWFGLPSECQASVETRVWCGQVIQGSKACCLAWEDHGSHSARLFFSPPPSYHGFMCFLSAIHF